MSSSILYFLVIASKSEHVLLEFTAPESFSQKIERIMDDQGEIIMSDNRIIEIMIGLDLPRYEHNGYVICRLPYTTSNISPDRLILFPLLNHFTNYEREVWYPCFRQAFKASRNFKYM